MVGAGDEVVVDDLVALAGKALVGSGPELPGALVVELVIVIPQIAGLPVKLDVLGTCWGFWNVYVAGMLAMPFTGSVMVTPRAWNPKPTRNSFFMENEVPGASFMKI